MQKSIRALLHLICIAALSLQLFFITSWHRCELSSRTSSSELQISTTGSGKPRRLLVVGILSKPSAFERRDAIRSTWMNVCKSRKQEVMCMIFTDTIEGEEGGMQERVLNELFTNNDMLMMPYKGGYNFAKRLVWMMSWFTEHFEFDFFLRIDDDYFLCLDQLLDELPFRPKHGLYWGFLHCRQHVVRIDEGWMILSADILQEALAKLNTTLLCHPFGDQAVALWIQDSKINITYFADPRIEHSASGYDIYKFLGPSICRNYLGLHGSYPLIMLKYWTATQSAAKVFDKSARRLPSKHKVPKILPYDQVCQFEKKFDTSYFYPHVRFDPKPCKDNPTWSNSNQNFVGREQDKNQIY